MSYIIFFSISYFLPALFQKRENLALARPGGRGASWPHQPATRAAAQPVPSPEAPLLRSPAPLSLALVPLTAGPHCPIALARRLLPPHAKSRRRRRNPDLLGITNPLAPSSKNSSPYKYPSPSTRSPPFPSPKPLAPPVISRQSRAPPPHH